MSGSFEEWKEDWRENQEKFEPGQSELFKMIREAAFSRIERGSISSELLNLVIDEENSELEDEKEVFKSLRKKQY